MSTNLTRDLLGAKEAYKTRDVEASLRAHQRKVLEHQQDEAHNDARKENLKSFVFGGLDGIVTIFCVVAGCQGVRVSPKKLIIVGIANLIGDAASMGLGEYISSKTEVDFEKEEMRREAWEMEHFPEEEQREMIDLYMMKYQFTREDASNIVDIGWKYPEYFLNNMMIEELGIMTDSNDQSPAVKGAIMFTSFVLFGLVPLASFASYESIMGNTSNDMSFIFACLVSSLALFCLGAAKGHVIDQSIFKCGMTMTFNGALAGGCAYVLGHIGNTIASRSMS